jgi:hypothetical protein
MVDAAPQPPPATGTVDGELRAGVSNASRSPSRSSQTYLGHRNIQPYTMLFTNRRDRSNSSLTVSTPNAPCRHPKHSR